MIATSKQADPECFNRASQNIIPRVAAPVYSNLIGTTVPFNVMNHLTNGLMSMFFTTNGQLLRVPYGILPAPIPNPACRTRLPTPRRLSF